MSILRDAGGRGVCCRAALHFSQTRVGGGKDLVPTGAVRGAVPLSVDAERASLPMDFLSAPACFRSALFFFSLGARFFWRGGMEGGVRTSARAHARARLLRWRLFHW